MDEAWKNLILNLDLTQPTRRYRNWLLVHRVDSVLSIQVFCAVNDPRDVMKEVWKLWKLLKPGSKFVSGTWARRALSKRKGIITLTEALGRDMVNICCPYCLLAAAFISKTDYVTR
ncbi:hypothetical protein N7468_006843 [Penicillium chermesinum]|uniref:Uncharacterized protein n=1 Tax=Penicillium chermesinum TaxID=63820 RepID=A0A9W9TK24_9EURO|nr:uncharacterized protein N7468_006843 [Penicillium chermesinum]KAJ5225618.1 hypothetical protein N7468_006843 [Penicillium chermesinum]